MTASATLLVAHGSPDPDWARPLRATVERMRQLAPETTVELAFLSGDPDPAQAVARLVGAGVTHVCVIAAFLSPGGRHIKRDLPELVETLRASHPNVEFELVPGALGDDSGVVEAMARAALNRSPAAKT